MKDIESEFGKDSIIIYRKDFPDAIRAVLGTTLPDAPDAFWQALAQSVEGRTFPSEVRTQAQCLADLIHGFPAWKEAELHIRQAIAIMQTYDPEVY